MTSVRSQVHVRHWLVGLQQRGALPSTANCCIPPAAAPRAHATWPCCAPDISDGRLRLLRRDATARDPSLLTQPFPPRLYPQTHRVPRPLLASGSFRRSHISPLPQPPRGAAARCGRRPTPGTPGHRAGAAAPLAPPAPPPLHAACCIAASSHGGSKPLPGPLNGRAGPPPARRGWHAAGQCEWATDSWGTHAAAGRRAPRCVLRASGAQQAPAPVRGSFRAVQVCVCEGRCWHLGAPQGLQAASKRLEEFESGQAPRCGRSPHACTSPTAAGACRGP